MVERYHGHADYESGLHGYGRQPHREGDYGPRNVEQRNFVDGTVYVTTPHRDRMSQPIVRSQPHSDRTAARGSISTHARPQIDSKRRVQNPRTVKTTSPAKKGSTLGTKHEKDGQTQQ